jgi:hypothetical protein
MSLYFATRSQTPCNSYSFISVCIVAMRINEEEEINLKKIDFIVLGILFGFFPLTICYVASCFYNT